MRRPLERLAWLISGEPDDATVGELSMKYDEPARRIMDAMDADKMRRGVPTSIPHVDWSVPPELRRSEGR